MNENKCLIISPHQDDEILGCSTIIAENHMYIHDVWFVVKGGGYSPNHPDLLGNDLYKVRCEESKKALSCFKNIGEIKFLGIERINGKYVERKKVEAVLGYHFKQYHKQYSQILTTSEYDKHDEHQLIGNIVKELSLEKSLDFNLKVLNFYISKELEEKSEGIIVTEFKLTDEQLKIKKTLVKIFETQKHFLPNIVERPSYRFERFYNE